MIKREYDVNINSGVGTYAKGGKIRIESGNKGKTRVVYDKKKDNYY